MSRILSEGSSEFRFFFSGGASAPHCAALYSTVQWSSVPAPTIISIVISIIISMIIRIIVSIIISIMISIIIIVMNVKTLIINISTIGLIHTSSTNGIEEALLSLDTTAEQL